MTKQKYQNRHQIIKGNLVCHCQSGLCVGAGGYVEGQLVNCHPSAGSRPLSETRQAINPSVDWVLRPRDQPHLDPSIPWSM